MMKSTFSKKSLCLVATLGGLAHAYLIDPPTTAASDTVQDCSNWVVVSSSDKCLTLADDNGITLAQFQIYNPSVGTSCELISGNSYCTEQNFGIPPEPVSTSAAPTSSTKPTPTNGVSTPTPTQSPFISNCEKFYLVKTGDGCEAIATTNSITFEQFYSWNPAVGQCANLWPTYYVCVGIIGFTPTSKPTTASSTTTITKTTPTNGIVTPTPTQSPFISNCNKFYQVRSGDGCEAIAIANSISFDQFYAWNPAVGQCINLWPTYFVCVGIIGFTPTSSTKISTTVISTSTKTTATNGITTPTPTQSGIVGNCDAFYKVVTDDGCAAIASKYGITTAQFYTWNPSIGNTCASLWPDYYVCVSVIGVNPSFATSIKPTSTVKPSSTSTKAGGVATPTPIQTGMIATCKKFYKVVTGDGCWAIADTNKITLDNFYKWNAAIKTDCSALWPGYYVCIGI